MFFDIFVYQHKKWTNHNNKKGPTPAQKGTDPNSEIYCDYPKEKSKSCRDLGAFQSYTERLKQNKAMGEYRRTYQQKFMQVKKNKDNKKLAKSFENWKKQAKEKINQMKKGKLSEDEVYEWIIENK